MKRIVQRRFQRFVMATIIVALGVFASTLQASLTTQQRRDVLNEAQQAYDQGISVLRSNPFDARSAFSSAAQRFEMVVNDGVVNGTLYYNLANAYLQAGDVGRAILNYRRAERLISGDARLQNNLQYARSLRHSQIAASGDRVLAQALLTWHHAVSLRWRFGGFLACYLSFWLIVLLRAFWLGRGATISAGVLALVWIVLGTSVAADVQGWGRHPVGVILTDNVIVRKGNGTGFEPQFEQSLSIGVEFEQLERRGDWIYIELPDGKSGWIESRVVEMVP